MAMSLFAPDRKKDGFGDGTGNYVAMQFQTGEEK